MKKNSFSFAVSICFFTFLFFATTSAAAPPGTVQTQAKGERTSPYTFKIIPAAEKTFGYEVYQGDKLLIRQANIPGMSGMKGFKRKSDAEKVAKLVVEKLGKGIMPPTIEKAEMEKLKVQF